MSNQISGYLEETESKSITSKKTGKQYTVYKGNVGGKWIEFGFNPPKGIAKGDYIYVELEQDGNFEKVKNYGKSEAPVRQPEPSRNQPAVAAAPTAQTDRQSSIIYQSSRKDALELVNVLIAQDALPISSAKTAAGKAKRYEEIMALVDKLTVQYFYDVHTLRNLDRVADAGVDAPIPEALPEAELDDPAPDGLTAKELAADGANW